MCVLRTRQRQTWEWKNQGQVAALTTLSGRVRVRTASGCYVVDPNSFVYDRYLEEKLPMAPAFVFNNPKDKESANGIIGSLFLSAFLIAASDGHSNWKSPSQSLTQQKHRTSSRASRLHSHLSDTESLVSNYFSFHRFIVFRAVSCPKLREVEPDALSSSSKDEKVEKTTDLPQVIVFSSCCSNAVQKSRVKPKLSSKVG